MGGEKTTSYAIDAFNRKVKIGDTVIFENDKYEIIDFQYLPRSVGIQYLKLKNCKNERKIKEYVDSNAVRK